MSTAAEREQLKELADKVRRATTWVAGPRIAALSEIADTLTAMASDESEPAGTADAAPEDPVPEAPAKAQSKSTS